VTKDRIVAVGLLTARDLEVLGAGFNRSFRLPDDDTFSALLGELDRHPPVDHPDPKISGAGMPVKAVDPTPVLS
jgi:hypothetical protein